MSQAVLEDIAVHSGTTEPIAGVVRIETSPLEETTPMFMAKMRSVYPHEEVFGQYCTVNDYVDCPPDELFEYLSHTNSLEEWTYTVASGHQDLHPHGGQRAGPYRRLPLRLGPG
jgi:hypothetical protein